MCIATLWKNWCTSDVEFAINGGLLPMPRLKRRRLMAALGAVIMISVLSSCSPNHQRIPMGRWEHDFYTDVQVYVEPLDDETVRVLITAPENIKLRVYKKLVKEESYED